MDLQQVSWIGVNWIDLAQNSVQWRASVKVEEEIWLP